MPKKLRQALDLRRRTLIALNEQLERTDGTTRALSLMRRVHALERYIIDGRWMSLGFDPIQLGC